MVCRYLVLISQTHQQYGVHHVHHGVAASGDVSLQNLGRRADALHLHMHWMMYERNRDISSIRFTYVAALTHWKM